MADQFTDIQPLTPPSNGFTDIQPLQSSSSFDMQGYPPGQSPHDTDAPTAADIQRASATPTHPTKWNMGETRSPQQVLQDYASTQPQYTNIQMLPNSSGYTDIQPIQRSDTDPEDGSMLRTGAGFAAGVADQATMFLGIPKYALTHLGTVGGGLTALANVVLGHENQAGADVAKFQKWNAVNAAETAIGKDGYLTENAGWKLANAPMDWLEKVGGKAADWVFDKTGSPLLGTIAYAGTQALPFIVGHKIWEAGKPDTPEVKATKENLGQSVHQAVMGTLETAVNDTTDSRPRYTVPEGSTPDQAFEERKRNGTVQDLLDLVSDNPELSKDDPMLQRVAQAMRQHSFAQGLDKGWTEYKETLPDGGMAEHDPMLDLTTLTAQTRPLDVIHEVGHKITSAAITMWDAVKNGVNDPTKAFTDANGNRVTLDTMTEAQKDMYYRVDALNDVYEKALEKAKADALKNVSNASILPADTPLHEIAGRDYYGFQDLHEFVAETLSNPKFRDILRNIEVTPKDGLVKASWTKGIFRSMLDLAKRAIKGIQAPDAFKGDTALDYAWDHVHGMVDHMTPDLRTPMVKDWIHESGASRPALSNLQSVIRDRGNPDTARAKVGGRDAQFLLYSMANLLKNAASPGEFIERSRALWSHPDFQSFLDRNLPKMLNSPVNFIRAFGRDETYKNLTSDERALTADSRSLDDFMAEHKQKAVAKYMKEGFTTDPDKVRIKEKDDLFDDGTFFLGPTQLKPLKAMAKGALAGEVLKFFAEKGEEYRALGAQMHYKGMRYLDDYKALSATGKKNVMKVAFQYDNINGRETLRQMGLQWPTADMLKEKGLNDAEIKAYEGRTKMYDFSFELTNQALAKDGKPPIEQIPGYMPHFYEGAYRVLVKAIKSDPLNPKAEPREFIVHVAGFSTRWGAQKFIKVLESGARDDAATGTKFRPDVQPSGEKFAVKERQFSQMSMSQSMAEHMQAYKNYNELDPNLQASVEALEAKALQGSVKHILERSDVGGYRGDIAGRIKGAEDMGFNTGILARLGLDAYNNRLLKTDEVYMKNIAEFYKNTMFMKEVATRLFDHQPLDSKGDQFYGDYLDNAKMLREYVKEYTSNFTGENYNHLSWIDREITPILKWAGLDPNLARNTLVSARNFLSLSKLRGNAGFYLGNFVQPLHMVSILSWANEIRRQGGHSIDYKAPMAAFAKAITNRNDPMLRESLQWAKDNHIIDDAMLEYMIRSKAPSTIMNWVHTLTLGKVNPYIEMFARSYSFAIAHEFYREIYGNDSMKVRRAAQQAMEMVNVNYDRTTRPLMYQNFGMAGEAMSPFAVYRNAYIGNNWLMFKAIKSGKFSPQSFLPLLHFQMIYLATAGAAGLMMTDEWDQITKLWNYFNPGHPLMDSTQAALALQKQVGAPDAFTFGALSQATKAIPGLEHGVNLGSSMTASGLDSSLTSALSPFLAALGNLAVVGAKAGAHAVAPETFPGISIAQAWPSLENLVPQPLRGPMERYAVPNKNVAMKTTDYEGYVERGPADWNSMLAFGRLSVDEAKARAQEKSIKEVAEFQQQHLKDLVSNAATHVSMGGSFTQQSFDDAARQAVNDLGVTADEFQQMVEEELDRRVTTTREREDREDTTSAARARRSRELFGGYQ